MTHANVSGLSNGQQLAVQTNGRQFSARASHNMKSDLTLFFNSFFREHEAQDEAQDSPDFDLSIGNVCHIPEVHEVLREALQYVAKKMVTRITKYPGTQGYFPLHQKIAEIVKKETGHSIEPEQIVLTNGALDALYHLFYTVCNPGDYCFYCLPSFPYWSPAGKAGVLSSLVIYSNPFNYSSTFGSLFAEKARTNKNIKLILLNEPHNPIGQNLERGELKIISDTCKDEQITLVADEVYRSFNNDDWCGKYIDINQSVMIDSFSKRFGMPGLRLGFVHAEGDYVKHIRASMANQVVGVNMLTALIADHVAEVALETNLMGKISKVIAHRQHLLDSSLKKLKNYGVISRKPDGSIYRLLMFDELLESTGLSINDVHAALSRNMVKTVPGDKLISPGIDMSRGPKILRLSVGGEPRTAEAGERIMQTVEELQGRS